MNKCCRLTVAALPLTLFCSPLFFSFPFKSSFLAHPFTLSLHQILLLSLPLLKPFYSLPTMVKILSNLLPCLAFALHTFAANVELSRLETSNIAVRNVDNNVVPIHEATLDIHVEFETHASLIVGLGHRNFGLDLELGGHHKPHLGFGFRAKGPVGLSVDICLRAFLANLQLTMDGNVLCTGPSDLSNSLAKQSIIGCTCTDPNVSLDLHLPDEKDDLEATIDLFSVKDFHFVLTIDGKTYPITVNQPAKTCDDTNKCKMEYHNTVTCH